MSDNTKLVIVKAVHSIIWVVMAFSSVYILYAGITGNRTLLLDISIGLLVIETAVLVANKWVCPLTPIAMRYTADRSDNFDIYLPRLVAKHNKTIFGTIFVLGLLLVALNAIR